MNFTLDKAISAYIDGSCIGNPGPGGWGVFFIQDDYTFEIFGSDPQTTNNKMEMLAAIKAIEATPKECSLVVFTDSSYLKNGITTWIKTWKINGWRTYSKQIIKNRDLWIKIDKLSIDRNITWNWIKGHSGVLGNEKADELAKKGASIYLNNIS